MWPSQAIGMKRSAPGEVVMYLGARHMAKTASAAHWCHEFLLPGGQVAARWADEEETPVHFDRWFELCK